MISNVGFYILFSVTVTTGIWAADSTAGLRSILMSASHLGLALGMRYFVFGYALQRLKPHSIRSQSMEIYLWGTRFNALEEERQEQKLIEEALGLKNILFLIFGAVFLVLFHVYFREKFGLSNFWLLVVSSSILPIAKLGYFVIPLFISFLGVFISGEKIFQDLRWGYLYVFLFSLTLAVLYFKEVELRSPGIYKKKSTQSFLMDVGILSVALMGIFYLLQDLLLEKKKIKPPQIKQEQLLQTQTQQRPKQGSGGTTPINGMFPKSMPLPTGSSPQIEVHQKDFQAIKALKQELRSLEKESFSSMQSDLPSYQPKDLDKRYQELQKKISDFEDVIKKMEGATKEPRHTDNGSAPETVSPEVLAELKQIGESIEKNIKPNIELEKPTRESLDRLGRQGHLGLLSKKLDAFSETGSKNDLKQLALEVPSGSSEQSKMAQSHDTQTGGAPSSVNQSIGTQNFSTQETTNDRVENKPKEEIKKKPPRDWSWLKRIPKVLGVLALLWFVYNFLKRKKPNPEVQTPKTIDKKTKKEILRRFKALDLSKLTPRQEIIVRYQIFLEVMASMNNQKPQWLPPQEYSEQSVRRFPSISTPIQSVTEIFSSTLYGMKEVSHQILQQFRSDFDKILAT